MNFEVARIVLCIKPIKSSLMGAGFEEGFQINPYELKVLKELAELKKEKPESFLLTCVCMGAKSSESVLRRALAMGADEAVLISDKIFAGSDTVATSYILSHALKKIKNVQLVICGSKSIDGETGQVPIAISERMQYALYTNISEIISLEKQEILFYKKEKNAGVVHKGELPAVITYQEFQVKEENISLLALKRASKRTIPCWNSEELQVIPSKCGLSGSKTQVREVHSSTPPKNGKVFYETNEEAVAVLADMLKNYL